MAQYTATIEWRAAGDPFLTNRYSRAHEWKFDGGAVVRASASPHVVKVPLSDPTGVDPEEAFVAALSSCHMLWFLSIAAKQGFAVESYVDKAVGYMERDERGRLSMTRVRLRPEIVFTGEQVPGSEEIGGMHDTAHEECFIANSVRTQVTVEQFSE